MPLFQTMKQLFGAVLRRGPRVGLGGVVPLTDIEMQYAGRLAGVSGRSLATFRGYAFNPPALAGLQAALVEASSRVELTHGLRNLLAAAKTAQARGVGTLGVVKADLPRAEWIRAALHEQGHLATGVSELTTESIVAVGAFRGKNAAIIEKLQSDIMDITRGKLLPGQALGEVFAESISLYRQKRLRLGTAATSRYYFPSGVSKQEARAMRKLGRSLWHSSTITKALGEMPATDDFYNVLEGIRHGGMAQNMREGLDIKFGSGWTRDVTWQLPYQLSLSLDRVGPIYRGIALSYTKHLRREHTKPGTSYIVGTENIYSMALPSVVPESMVDVNTKVREYSTWGNMGLSPALAGMSHGGLAGATRHYRTGFGSGWRGTDSTIGAQQDFIGMAPPAVEQEIVPAKTVSTAARRFENAGRLPQVNVKLAQLGITRRVVDRDISRIVEHNFGRKVRDYIRKAQMAQEQDQTVYNLFFNALKGSKRHLAKAA